MASVTLYRKYRPQFFADIVNQDHIKATIQQEIVSDQLPHAFLFYGPRGIGKTTTARILAKSLNCQKRKKTESEPCNSCESCVSMTEGKSLSLVEVDAASQTGVDNVRENIIASARVAVKADEFKVFIIDEVHMLSTSSFNALLKTLEEPPERVVFILATTEIHKIPDTIISRCQRFDYHPVASGILKDHLAEIVKKEKRKVEDPVLQAIVKKSGGHVRDAMSLLSQVLSLPGDITTETASMILPVNNVEHVISFFDQLSQQQVRELMIFLSEIEKQGIRPQHFCQALIDFAHQLLLFNIGSHLDIFAGEVADAELKTIKTISERYTPESLLIIIDVLMKRRLQLKNYDQGKLPLELAVIELTQERLGFDHPQQGDQTGVLKTETIEKVVDNLDTKTKNSDQKLKISKVQSETVSKTVAEKVVVKDVLQAVDIPVKEVPLPTDVASYDEVYAVWPKFMEELSSVAHSLFIVMRSAELRKGGQGEPVLAFRFQMHHDHIKRGMMSLIEHGLTFLPEKKMKFTLVIDENMDFAPGGDVEELKSDEKEEFSQELSQLADAFGGSVME